jgi:hypothetical protein
MKKVYLLLIIVFISFACDKKERTPEKIDIAGTWEYVSLNVTMNSPDNNSGEEFFYVLPGEWEAKVGITPIVTDLNEDGTFENNFYAFPDSVPRGGRGTWNIQDDSLIFMEGNQRIAYEFTLNDSMLTIRGKTDFDQDGKSDDDYVGVQKRK